MALPVEPDPEEMGAPADRLTDEVLAQIARGTGSSDTERAAMTCELDRWPGVALGLAPVLHGLAGDTLARLLLDLRLVEEAGPSVNEQMRRLEQRVRALEEER